MKFILQSACLLICLSLFLILVACANNAKPSTTTSSQMLNDSVSSHADITEATVSEIKDSSNTHETTAIELTPNESKDVTESKEDNPVVTPGNPDNPTTPTAPEGNTSSTGKITLPPIPIKDIAK